MNTLIEEYKLPSKHISASQITLYYSCGLKYYKRYVEGVIKHSSSYRDMMKGTAVHKTLQQLYDDKILRMSDDFKELRNESVDCLTPTQVGELAIEKYSELHEQEENSPISDTDKHDFVTGVKPVVETYAKYVYPYVTPVSTEFEVTFNYVVNQETGLSVPILMIIDLFRKRSVNPGDNVICDYKVTTRKWDVNKLKNNVQFMLYSNMLSIPSVEIHDLVKHTPSSNTTTSTITRKRTKKEIEGCTDYSLATKFDETSDTLSFNDVTIIRNEFETGNEAPATKYLDRIIKGFVLGVSKGVFLPAQPDSWVCSEKWCEYYTECRKN